MFGHIITGKISLVTLSSPQICIFRCDYCHISYDVIGKTETMQEDTVYILSKAGIDRSKFPMKTHHSSGGSSEDLAQTYFKQLDKKTVLKLYNMYHIDFVMFGYSPEPYLSLAKDNN